MGSAEDYAEDVADSPGPSETLIAPPAAPLSPPSPVPDPSASLALHLHAHTLMNDLKHLVQSLQKQVEVANQNAGAAAATGEILRAQMQQMMQELQDIRHELQQTIPDKITRCIEDHAERIQSGLQNDVQIVADSVIALVTDAMQKACTMPTPTLAPSPADSTAQAAPADLSTPALFRTFAPAAPAVAAPPPAQNTRQVRGLKLKEPEPFTGQQRDHHAEQWLNVLDDYLQCMGVADTDKVVYAAALLRTHARTWWDLLKGRGETPRTWPSFRSAFLARIMSPAAPSIALADLMRVRQQTRLPRFIDHVESLLHSAKIDTADRMAREAFLNGLPAQLQKDVRMQNPNDMQQAIDLAKQVDAACRLAGTRTRNQANDDNTTVQFANMEAYSNDAEASCNAVDSPARQNAPGPAPGRGRGYGRHGAAGRGNGRFPVDPAQQFPRCIICQTEGHIFGQTRRLQHPYFLGGVVVLGPSSPRYWLLTVAWPTLLPSFPFTSVGLSIGWTGPVYVLNYPLFLP